MSLSSPELAQVVIALALLVLAAHALGYLFARLRQPPVIGEILGGLLLGPTVLGLVAPAAATVVAPKSATASAVLGAFYQLGLLTLMFLAGGEVRRGLAAGERRTVAAVSLTGLVVPVAAGFAVAHLVDSSHFSGPHGSRLTFALVFGIAVGVTSIPVISRIMLDLGILHTSFARVVLSVAVVEDLVLYVALAVVLGLVRARDDTAYGLVGLVKADSPALTASVYIGATLVLLAVFLVGGGRLFCALTRLRANPIERRDATAFRLAFLLVLVLICLQLGIDPIFGALMAGMSVARGDALAAAQDAGKPGSAAAAEARRLAWESIRRFSFALFVPVYFAIVGLKLDLIHHFDAGFFLWFFLLACAVKAGSVWTGARLAGESRRTSTNLAVALNARGGPGIVLASVTYAAGVINETFYTALVLLAILTSQVAGAWLDRARGRLAVVPAEPGPAADLVPAGRAEAA